MQDLETLWLQMQEEKGDLETRSEEYARLTLPYLCAPAGSEGSEQLRGAVAIAPRLVNHLANRIVDTMFPGDRPFFTVTLTPETRAKIRDEAGEEAETQFAETVRTETALVEQAGMRKMGLTAYRPVAVEAVKHLIAIGNTLIRRMEDNKRIAYGIRDYCVRRRIDGAPYEVLLRDSKKFEGLSEEYQARILEVHPNTKAEDPVILFTHYKFDGKRWGETQAVRNVHLRTGKRYKANACPVLPLAWSLTRGENYARGLVEDHITTFHNVDVCSIALLEMVGVMADVKWLVDPGSGLDVVALNKAPRGSYHAGRKDDITTPEGARRLEIGALRDIISGWERELAQSFLLNSSTTRDAERVTAEEIRFVANELESAFGGLYSRLALEWQQHEADYVVAHLDFNTEVGGALTLFDVVITSGLESLSRQGQLANLRYAIADLSVLDGVPEEIRQSINPAKFAAFVFTNHAVRHREFMFTADEMKANQEAAIKQQEQLAGIQANANVQQEAGKAAVQENR